MAPDDPQGPLGIRDATNLVSLFRLMISDSREQHAREHELMDERLDSLEGSVHEHHTKAERDAITLDARVRPLRAALNLVVGHWREAVIILFALIGLVDLVGDFILRFGSR